MNTQQIKRALERDPKTTKKFCGVFPADQLPKVRFPVDLWLIWTRLRNQGHIGWYFTFPLTILENFLTVTDNHLNITTNPLKLILNFMNGNEIHENYKVRGLMCVGIIVFFTYIREHAVIA